MKNYVETLSGSKKTYRHIFFDVDQTLTRSRSLIDPDMKETLTKLAKANDVVIVSGAKEEQIWRQVSKDFVGKVYILAQNGNFALSKDGKDLWKNYLSEEQKAEIFKHISDVKDKYKELFKNVDENDLAQDRGCQVTFSFVGHNADLKRKEAFDPNGSLRQSILEKIPFKSKTIEVKIGGTTSFDYFEKGKNKGHNVRQIIDKYGWGLEDSLYVGDALFKGGNDESVMGVCDTLQVSGPKDTLAVISKMV